LQQARAFSGEVPCVLCTRIKKNGAQGAPGFAAENAPNSRLLGSASFDMPKTAAEISIFLPKPDEKFRLPVTEPTHFFGLRRIGLSRSGQGSRSDSKTC
jgi:hypothetical protein